MGLGTAGLALYGDLSARGLMKPPMWICDLGSQDVYSGSTNVGNARDWMQKRGYNYRSIDIDGKHGAWPLDLNTASVEGLGQLAPSYFDIVTNHGTSEHVFNQANVFRFMHDLCVVGGLMIHLVPSPRYGAPHSFYYYDEVIFRHLADWNKYDTIKLKRIPDPNGELIAAVLRKQSREEFVIPIQDVYRQVVDA